jgi:hypothetical protein
MKNVFVFGFVLPVFSFPVPLFLRGNKRASFFMGALSFFYPHGEHLAIPFSAR